MTHLIASQPKLARKLPTLGALALMLAPLALAYGAVPALAIEPVQHIVSPGGIDALLIESHDVGIISMRFSFRGGAAEDPADKPGVAQLTGFLFNEGAGDLDTQALAQRALRIGVDFSAEASAEFIDGVLSAPSAHRDEAFALLKLAVTAPRFDPDPLERGRQAVLASLQMERMDPASIAWNRLAAMAYQSSRFALPTKGTPEGLVKISMDDIRAYRSRVFARDNLRVAVAGDIDAATLTRLLDDVFGALPAKADINGPVALAPVRSQRESIPMDLQQTVVVFGNLGPVLDPRGSLAVSLFNQILSGQFTGRLFKTLREREGLVYSIATARSRLAGVDSFFGSFGAAPANAERAIALTMAEIKRLVNEGPSEQELRDAKSAFRGGYYLALDTSANLSSALLAMQQNGLPSTYLADLDSMIASITLEEVRATAKLAVRPDAMVIVQVGKMQGAALERHIP